MKNILNVYAQEESILQQNKKYIVNFLKKSYIYEYTKKCGCFLIRKGNEYFHLIAEETMGGGVKICLTSGVKERPNVMQFDYFYNCITAYSVERSRKYMMEYIEGLQLHRGLSITGAAALGFN